jgi:hypothetical protein
MIHHTAGKIDTKNARTTTAIDRPSSGVVIPIHSGQRAGGDEVPLVTSDICTVIQQRAWHGRSRVFLLLSTAADGASDDLAPHTEAVLKSGENLMRGPGAAHRAENLEDHTPAADRVKT